MKPSHIGASSGSHDVECREGIDDEPQLLMREERVQSHESQAWQGQCMGPLVHCSQGYEEKAAAQASGQGRVEIPQERGGLEVRLRKHRYCQRLSHCPLK